MSCPHKESHYSPLIAEACERSHGAGAIPKEWDRWSPVADTWSYDASMGGKVLTIVVWNPGAASKWKASANWGDNRFFVADILKAKDEATAKKEAVDMVSDALTKLAGATANALALMERVPTT